jgi:hypothetical protein
VVPFVTMYGTHAIEHGSTRTGRWLRERRIRLTLFIAAFEGLLYVFGALHWWAAVLLALIAVGFWFYVARTHRSDTLRNVGWIFAASQLLVICVPIALKIVEWAAIGMIAILAIGALIYLFRERP